MQEVLCLLKSNRTSKHSWSTSTQACFLPCRRGPEPAAEVLCLSLLLSRNLQPSGSLLGCCCFLPKCFPSIVMGVYTACSFLSCKHISLLCHRLPERAVCGPQFEAFFVFSSPTVHCSRPASWLFLLRGPCCTIPRASSCLPRPILGLPLPCSHSVTHFPVPATPLFPLFCVLCRLFLPSPAVKCQCFSRLDLLS